MSISQVFQHCAYHRLQKQLWERLRRPILWWATDQLQFKWKLFDQPGKPDQFRLLYKKDFINEGTAKKNIRLKWIAMCLVMDYVTGEVWRKPKTEFHRACFKRFAILETVLVSGWTLYQWGKISSKEQEADWKTRGPRRVGIYAFSQIVQIVLPWIMSCPRKPLVIRLGHNYYDKTPLIGKIVDINIWDRWWSKIMSFKCSFDLKISSWSTFVADINISDQSQQFLQ